MKLKTISRIIALSLASTSALSTHLYAEENQETEDKKKDDNVIVVTSQKREQRLQDVPLSVQAFTEEELKGLGIDSSTDIANAVTNVQLNAAGGNGNQIITIRGIGLNDFALNNTPTAAVHIDEVALGSNAMTNFTVFDLERVEVLKGPQGTLFGRNSTAGVLNFITAKPTDYLEGYVRLTVGDYDTTNFEGVVSGPMTENLSYRASFKQDTSDEGFQTNTNSAAGFTENGKIDRWAGRFQLQWEDDSTLVNFKYQAGEDTSDPWLPQAEGLTAADGSLCASGLVGRPDPSECFINALFGASYQMISDTDGDVHSGAYNFKPVADDEFSGAALRIEHDTGNGTFISLTGVDEFNYRHQTDLDGVAAVNLQEIAAIIDAAGIAADLGLDPIGTFLFAQEDAFANSYILNQLEDFEIEQVSQEFRFVSPGGETFNYLLGAFFTSDEIKNTTGYQSDAFSLFLGLPLPGAVYNHEFEQSNDSYAFFAQGDYAISDVTTVTFGMRYTKDEKEFINRSYGSHPAMAEFLELAFGIPGVDQLPILPDLFGFGLDMTLPSPNIDGYSAELIDDGSRLRQKAEFSHVSWKLGVDHKLEDDWMIYASVADGYKAGGFPGVIPTAGLFESTPYSEETIMSYEFGTKLSALDNTLRLNAALFFNDYEDMQGVYATSVGFDRLERVGDAKINGIELDGVWDLTDSLTWSFGISNISTEIENGSMDAVDFTGVNPRAAEGRSLFDGNELAHSPQVTATSRLEYDLSVGDDMYMIFQVNMSYKSDYYLRYDNTPNTLWDKSTTVFGFRVSLGDLDDVWQVALWGKNVTDEEFPTYQSFSLDKADQFVFYNAPARFGIDLTYRFGE